MAEAINRKAGAQRVSAERRGYQIIRKDGKDCFVESLSDSFAIGRAHLVFAAYDASKPVGERQTNNVSIFIDMPEVLELCRKMESGEMRSILQTKKDKKDNTPIQEWTGGTAAEKLAERGKAREDGMSLSRVAKLLCGSKYDFMLIADSGPGEQTEKGLIVPRFVGKGENHVVVGLSWDDFSELFLTTKVHYEAWLVASYLRKLD